MNSRSPLVTILPAMPAAISETKRDAAPGWFMLRVFGTLVVLIALGAALVLASVWPGP